MQKIAVRAYFRMHLDSQDMFRLIITAVTDDFGIYLLQLLYQVV